jgi:hypothetical protein
MQIVNKKLPKNDSRNTSFCVPVVIGVSLEGTFNQWGIARPPMPNLSHASKKTGKALTKGFERAT